MRKIFQNWGGNLNFRPAHYIEPKSINEIQNCIQRAQKEKKNVRVVGSGHSWTKLIQTSDYLLQFNKMQGLYSLDPHSQTAVVHAGTKLKLLGELLKNEELAMENLGDIDAQSLAGSFATGTHGTGASLGILSTQAREFEIINADGEVENYTSDDPQFPALQVSLGLLGVVTKIKIQALPQYKLHSIKVREKLNECLDKIEHYKRNNRHFEFFWFPYSEWVCAKFLNPTRETISQNEFSKFFIDVVYENSTYKAISELCRLVPNLSAPMSRLSASGISTGKEIQYSHKIFATPRMVRFYEMEYAVPAEEGPKILLKIKDWITKNEPKVHFPIEYRYVQADNIWLSPAYQRDSAYIAVHMYQGMPYLDYFKGIERIFWDYGGRPHWGKMHSANQSYLKNIYPKWDDFLQLRAKMDTGNMFLNPYLKELFF